MSWFDCIVQLFSSLFSSSYEYTRILSKWMMHKLTKKSEIERICSQPMRQSSRQTVAFLFSLKRSKQLKTIGSIIFYPKPFTISRVLPLIVEIKKISATLQPNIIACLNDLRIINLIYDKLEYYKKLKYSEQSKSQVHSQLEELWNHLKPGMKRSNEFLSNDWSEIGFQGKDPTTDFRGMGLLGLYQLVYYSKTRPESARNVLLESNHPIRFIPFAATGINITAFLMELVQQCRFHIYLLHNMPSIRNYNDSIDGSMMENELIEVGIKIMNDVYCNMYESFMKLWVEKNPPSIMSFQSIFTEFKTTTRKKYRFV